MRTLPDLDIAFADTSAADLRFSLDRSRLPSLAARTLAVPGTAAAVELHVIGSSHQVVLRHLGADAFIETFACLGEDGADITPPWESTRLSSGSWAGFTDHEFSCSRQAIPGDADFEAAVAEVVETSRGHDDHVLVRFPGDPHALTALALTRVEPDHLCWRTWHCYPQHHEIVHSTGGLHRTEAGGATGDTDGRTGDANATSNDGGR